MKVYLNNPKESWVVDRFREEWLLNNKSISTKRINSADVIWLISPWTWKKVGYRYLKNKKVVCTIHHIDEDKFDKNEERNFYQRDLIVDEYHAISDSTFKQLRKLTNKKINNIPFWLNTELWHQIEDKKLNRDSFNIPVESFVVGSFQRDTEGSDLKSPKLSKGPDQFFEIIKNLNLKQENLLVLLTGKRRQYIIEKLKEEEIDFLYFEMVDFNLLNKLYNCLDLYIVASRVEGGPASLIECASIKIPVISTNVGIATKILNNTSIFNMTNFESAKPDVETAYKNSLKYKMPEGFDKYIKMFNEIYEN